MDIEGHEYSALKGGINTITASRALLILEYKAKTSTTGQPNLAQRMVSEIRAIGYMIFSLDNGFLAPFDASENYENILCIPKERGDTQDLFIQCLRRNTYCS
jgi:hypothetical protein